MELNAQQVRWQRIRRSGLIDRFASPEECAERLLGVQAQMMTAALLAIWARTEGSTFVSLDGLLHRDKTLVRIWGQRHTLHLYPATLWPLIHSVRSDIPTWWEQSIIRNGGDLDGYKKAVAHAEKMLRANETLGRSDLKDSDYAFSERHLSPWGGLFAELVHKGRACLVDRKNGEARYAHRERWLPDLPFETVTADKAGIEICRRFFSTYGPATLQDFAYWEGCRVADARRYLETVRPHLTEVTVGGVQHFLAKDALSGDLDSAPTPGKWPVLLVYRFDPLVLAHKDKSWLVKPENYNKVWRPAGHIEGMIIDKGQGCGIWRFEKKSKLDLLVQYFGKPSGKVEKAVDRHGKKLAGFFQVPFGSVRPATLVVD